ncbi:hypothetical protein Tco_0459814 [Tanacetum coccineum]
MREEKASQALNDQLVLDVDQSIIYDISADVDTTYSLKSGYERIIGADNRDRIIRARLVLCILTLFTETLTRLHSCTQATEWFKRLVAYAKCNRDSYESTDIANITRKEPKPDKNGYENEKSAQEPKVSTLAIPCILIGGINVAVNKGLGLID